MVCINSHMRIVHVHHEMHYNFQQKLFITDIENLLCIFGNPTSNLSRFPLSKYPQTKVTLPLL